METVPEGVLSELGTRFGIVAEDGKLLAGGTASKVWRLDSVPPVVVRVSQFIQLKVLQRACRVAGEFAQMVPEAVRPLAGSDGESVFVWDGHPVTVWPFVDGMPLDRQDPALCRQAAGLLARLPRARLALPDIGDTWTTSGRQDPEVSRLLVDDELDKWLRSWNAGYTDEQPTGWMHRDFFPGNILCNEGTIVGLVDWDEVEWGPMIAELAWSVWEFGKTPGGDALMLDRARGLLTSYKEAGGPVEPSDALIPLIRDRLRRGIAFWTWVKEQGHEVDLTGTDAMASAFTSLRNVRLSGPR